MCRRRRPCCLGYGVAVGSGLCLGVVALLPGVVGGDVAFWLMSVAVGTVFPVAEGGRSSPSSRPLLGGIGGSRCVDGYRSGRLGSSARCC